MEEGELYAIETFGSTGKERVQGLVFGFWVLGFRDRNRSMEQRILLSGFRIWGFWVERGVLLLGFGFSV